MRRRRQTPGGEIPGAFGRSGAEAAGEAGKLQQGGVGADGGQLHVTDDGRGDGIDDGVIDGQPLQLRAERLRLQAEDAGEGERFRPPRGDGDGCAEGVQLPGEALADAAEAEDQDAAAAQRTGQAGQKRRQSRLSGQLGVFKGKGLVAGVIEPTQAVGLQGGHSRVQQSAADERIGRGRVQRGFERQIVRGGADAVRRAQGGHRQDEQLRAPGAGGERVGGIRAAGHAAGAHGEAARLQLPGKAALPPVAAQQNSGFGQNDPFFRSILCRAQKKGPCQTAGAEKNMTRLFLSVLLGQPMNHWVQYPPSAT